MELPSPFIVGCDLAGVVEAVGPEAKKLKPGDRVWGSNQGLLGRQGTFADFVAVEECWLYTLPEEVSERDAAAAALVGLTAHLGLFRDAQLKVGENVFVHGGCGGVASCVVQMAKAIDARVMTTSGNDEKMAICRRLGAATVVNYKGGDLDAAITKFGGIDVWWEHSASRTWSGRWSIWPCEAGSFYMAGRDAGEMPRIGPFYMKDASIHGLAMFHAPADEQLEKRAEINRWLAKGKLKPLIGRVMKLSEAAEAHRLQEESGIKKKGNLIGKIVLEL